MQNWQDEILKAWEAKKGKFKVSDDLRDRLATQFRGEVLYGEPMNAHTSMRVGGPADIFLKPVDLEDLKTIIRLAEEEQIPVTHLGSGSNTLVKDGGIRGMVVVPPATLSQCRLVDQGDDWGDLEVESAVKITRAVHSAREHSLSGLEPLVGIPGTIGGALFMNAGAHGVEMKDLVRSLTVLEKGGEVISLGREKLEFEYRKLKIPRTSFILSGIFRLKKGNREEISARMERYQKWRIEKQPLHFPNVGSVFKNPLPAKKGEKIPSAGQLIDEAGLKNVRIGGARISEKHANFIINENKAIARDVLVLINLARDKVKEMTGILLEPEVRIIGED